MRTRHRVRHRLLPVPLVLCLALPGSSGAVAVRGTDGNEAKVAFRSGDPAPVTVGVGSRFDSIATTPGALLFVDASGSALFEKRGDDLRILAYAGETVGEGRTLASLRAVAGGGDGSVAFLGQLPDRRDGIFRIGPAG